ncbi:MAG: asparagine synthetase B, partial [Kiritimatiellia bacterium]|nr:asparagine synthetase B [Kiritimatiellia bacterium]
MCGIAGFLGDFVPPLLDSMGDRIAHRGPDDHSSLYIAEQRVGLCHRRLSIIDLSPMGRQPMQDRAGRVAIVFNGEIYNYRELRADLESRGFQFETQTDTEVLLMLYRAEGTAMLGRLNGMFAFAIWDRSRDCLFLARDGFGVKPLYYCETPKGFLFASEIKALTAEASVSRDLDFDAIDHYVRYLWCPHPRTMLKAVKKLPPGTAMLVQRGKILKSWT